MCLYLFCALPLYGCMYVCVMDVLVWKCHMCVCIVQRSRLMVGVLPWLLFTFSFETESWAQNPLFIWMLWLVSFIGPPVSILLSSAKVTGELSLCLTLYMGSGELNSGLHSRQSSHGAISLALSNFFAIRFFVVRSILNWHWTTYIAEDDLELQILLPLQA